MARGLYILPETLSRPELIEREKLSGNLSTNLNVYHVDQTLLLVDHYLSCAGDRHHLHEPAAPSDINPFKGLAIRGSPSRNNHRDRRW